MGLLQHRGRVAAQGEVAEPLGDLEGASAPRQGFVQLSEVILDIHLGPIHPAAPALVSKLLDDTLGVAQILTHHSVVAERRHDVVARRAECQPLAPAWRCSPGGGSSGTLVLAPGTRHLTLTSRGGGGRDGGTTLARGHQRVNKCVGTAGDRRCFGIEREQNFALNALVPALETTTKLAVLRHSLDRGALLH